MSRAYMRPFVLKWHQFLIVLTTLLANLNKNLATALANISILTRRDAYFHYLVFFQSPKMGSKSTE